MNVFMKFIKTINQQLCKLLTIALVLTGVPLELFAAKKTNNKTKTSAVQKSAVPGKISPVPATKIIPVSPIIPAHAAIITPPITPANPAAPAKTINPTPTKPVTLVNPTSPVNPAAPAKTSNILIDTKKLTTLDLNSLETTTTSTTINIQACATMAMGMTECSASCSSGGTCSGSVACCTSFCSCVYPTAGANQASCISDCTQYYGNPADYINWRASILESSWENSVAQQICNLTQNFQSTLAKIQNYFTALGWAQTTLMNMNMQTYGTEALQPLPNAATSINNYYVTAAASCSSNAACLNPNITAQQKCLNLTVLGYENSCFNGNCTFSGSACTNDLQCPKKVCAIPNSQTCRVDSDCQADLQDLFCNIPISPAKTTSVQSIDPTTNAAVASPLNICMSHIGTVCDASGQKSNNCVKSITDSKTYTCSIDGLNCTTTKKCIAYTSNYCLANNKCALTGAACTIATEATDCPNYCTLNDGKTPNLDLQCTCLNPNADGSCPTSSPGVCTLVNTGAICVPGTGAIGTNADYTKCGYTGGLSCQIAPDETASKSDSGMTVCLLSLNTEATQGPLVPAITANYNSTTANNTNGCIAQTNIKGNNLCSVYGLTVSGSTASNITTQHTLASQGWFNENNLATAMSQGKPGSLMYDPTSTPAFNTAYNMLQVQASIYSGPLSPYSPIDPHDAAATGDIEYNLVCGVATMSDDGAFNKITVACTAAENANTATGFDLLLNEIATAANYLNPAIYNSDTFTPGSSTCALDPSNASAGQNNTNCPFAYPNVSATIPTSCSNTDTCNNGTCNYMGNPCMANSKGCVGADANCSLMQASESSTPQFAPQNQGYCLNLDGTNSTIACCTAADCTCNYNYCTNSLTSSGLSPSTSASSAGTGANYPLCLPSGTCSGYTTGCNLTTGTNMGLCINNSNPQNLIKSAINCCSNADCTCQPIANQLSGTGSTNTADSGYDNCASPYAGIFGNNTATMAYINCLLPAASNLGISPTNPWGGPCTADSCTTQAYAVPSGINPQGSLPMTCCGDCSVTCSPIANGKSVLTTQGSCVGQSCAIPAGFAYDSITNPDGVQDLNTLCCNGTYCCSDETSCTNGTLNTCVYATISTACPSKNSNPTDCIVTTYDANPDLLTTCPDPSINTPDPKTHPDNYCPNSTGLCVDNTGSSIAGVNCCDCYSIKCTDDTDCFVNYNSAQYSCTDTYCYNPNKLTCGGICQPKHGPTIANTTPMSGGTYDPTFNSICAQVGYAQTTLLTNYYNQDLTVASYYANEINVMYQTLDGISQITGNGKGTAYGDSAIPALNTQCYDSKTSTSNFCEPLSGYGKAGEYSTIVSGTLIMDMQAYVNALQAAIITTLNSMPSVIDGSITGNPTASPVVTATDTANGPIYQAIIKATGATCTGATCPNGTCTSGTGVCTFSDGTKQPDSTLATSKQAGSSITCKASLDCINNPISALVSTSWGGKNSTLKYLPFTATESIDPNFTGTVTPAVNYLDFAATSTTYDYSSIVTLGALAVPTTDISPANIFLPSNSNSCDNSNCSNPNSPAVDCNCTLFSELLAPYGALGQSLDPTDPSYAGMTPSLTTLATTHATLASTINALPSYSKVNNWDSNSTAIYNAYNQVMSDYQIVNYVYNALTSSGSFTTELTTGSSSCPQLNTPQPPQPITEFQINQQAAQTAAQTAAALAGLLESGGMFLIGGPIITKFAEWAWYKFKNRKGADPAAEPRENGDVPVRGVSAKEAGRPNARIVDGAPVVAGNVNHTGDPDVPPGPDSELDLKIIETLNEFDIEIGTTTGSDMLANDNFQEIINKLAIDDDIDSEDMANFETAVRKNLETRGDDPVDYGDFHAE
jgi:hypothetical protein